MAAWKGRKLERERDNEVTRKLQRSCPPSFPKATPGDPGEPRLPQRCRAIAPRAETHPKFGSTWPVRANCSATPAEVHRQFQVCIKIDPHVATFGHALSSWPKFAQVRTQNGQVWPTCFRTSGNCGRISAESRLPEQRFENCWARLGPRARLRPKLGRVRPNLAKIRPPLGDFGHRPNSDRPRSPLINRACSTSTELDPGWPNLPRIRPKLGETKFGRCWAKPTDVCQTVLEIGHFNRVWPTLTRNRPNVAPIRPMLDRIRPNSAQNRLTSGQICAQLGTQWDAF